MLILKNTICFVTAVLISGFVITGCNGEKNNPDNIPKDSTPLLIKGSETEFKMISYLVGLYHQKHPDVLFDISGGGSAIGIEALLDGKTDIANSSRAMTYEERMKAKAKGLDPVQVIIAMDAISIITHPKVRIDSLSLNQLSRLYSGEIKNWKEIGGADLPVKLIGRNEHSGTYGHLLNHLQIAAYAPGCEKKQRNDEIVTAVSQQQGAIGYVNRGSIYDAENKPIKTVWVASIYVAGGEAYSPYQAEYVKNGEYPLSRALYQYVNSPVSEKVKALLRFELSDSTQQELYKHGCFPITPICKTINAKNGF